MVSQDVERVLRVLVDHAWDREISWANMEAWSTNFDGATASEEVEQEHAMLALSRFIYFSKRLLREMLKSLYRDHFEAPLVQRIRTRLRGTRDSLAIRKLFKEEQASTRFVGLGNPAESGAHLLYYFRQVNHLPKDLFIDFGTVLANQRSLKMGRKQHAAVSRFIFFDDLVGSAQQSTAYLSRGLAQIRRKDSNLDLRFVSLFATTKGLEALNKPSIFDGKATCLFELDDTYKAFHAEQRYFPKSLSPDFDLSLLEGMARHYGEILVPGHALGYKDGQLLVGFTHNTPDNTLPIFWNEGRTVPWAPVFVRYDKVY